MTDLAAKPPATAKPLPNVTCPLCGGPNGCASAQRGSFDGPCWCNDATFTPELLARVPEDQRRIACICARCAAGAAAAERR